MCVVLEGGKQGDVPAKYVVCGLRPYERPVAGTYVDAAIVPGFSYKVRQLDSNNMLFKVTLEYFFKSQNNNDETMKNDWNFRLLFMKKMCVYTNPPPRFSRYH